MAAKTFDSEARLRDRSIKCVEDNLPTMRSIYRISIPTTSPNQQGSQECEHVKKVQVDGGFRETAQYHTMSNFDRA